MSEPLAPDPCFWESSHQHRSGSITLETQLRLDLNHIFTGVRHPDCSDIDEGFVARNSEHDVLHAAIMVCMLEKGFSPPIELQQALLSMLLRCETATWDELQAIESASAKSAPVLTSPLLSQIVLARALITGNRKLAKDIINHVPPAPRHDNIFSPDLGQQPTHCTETRFGKRLSLTHAMFRGQADNGCDVWDSMILAGWATPRRYMLLDAASCSNEESGSRLFETLRERGIRPDWHSVHASLAWGYPSIASLFLEHHVRDNGPLNPQRARDALSIVATRDDVQLLEMLSQRGIGNIHAVPDASERPSVAQREPGEGGSTQSLLHVAAESGSVRVVQWLLDHGVQNVPNAQGRTPYQAALDMQSYYSQRLDWNPNYQETVDKIQRVLEFLGSRGFGSVPTAL